MSTPYSPRVSIYHTDISEDFLALLAKDCIVACDLETSGLDWQTARIALCQLYIPSGEAAVVEITDTIPLRLCSVIADQHVKKVFHHALFDLRFMHHSWGVRPENVACTKIAVKILDREHRYEHSLKALLHRYMGLSLDKSQQTSNWLSHQLSPDQIDYAVADVLHLLPLLKMLEDDLSSAGLLDLAHGCFQHVPTRVRLDTMHYHRVFSY